MRIGRWIAVLGMAGGLAGAARADVPFPTCAAAGCSDPADFGSYLFIAPGALPNDYDPGSGEAWKFAPDTGMDVIGGWETTTGRPDVVIAVLDSGIEWDRVELARKVALNAGELPIPPGCPTRDCNEDGFVSVDDFQDACAADPNGNGFCDGQDLIVAYSDGVDDDGNAFVDDIAGWDFQDGDNDPSDVVRYGHGTGEAADEVAEANDGSGFPGVAPSSMFLPLKVADSFVGVDQDFLQAVVYAVDRHVGVISEALGTVNASRSGQAAVDYAYRRGIPLIASAADEESRHHNYPANYDHVIWVNSVRNGDGTFLDATANGYDLLNGCTNFGGHAWVAIPSTSCSSEATSRAGGLAALLVSHGYNLLGRGQLTPYPGLATPFSAEEVRQLMRLAAHDVDHSTDPSLVLTAEAGLFNAALSAPALGLTFGSARFPTQPEWDQFTGYGRPDARALLSLASEATLPPEADLVGGPEWFEPIDPAHTPSVDLVGTARAARRGNVFDWTLEVGCGVQPLAYDPIAAGAGGGAPLEAALLASWSPAATAAGCGFDPAGPLAHPDAHTVTLRLRVTDALGNVGEDRRTVSVHSDPTLRFAARRLDGSNESSPALADVDRDGSLEIVLAGGDGSVHVIDGATGADLPGFPVKTRALAVHDSTAWALEVPVPHEAVIGAVAADDLEGDGRVEIVAAGIEGRLYVFDDHGALRPGFPVATDPALSDPAQRDPLNDTDPGLTSAPTLADLDPPGVDPTLEIVLSGLDGHLYAWRADGAPVAGFPVRLADPAKVSIDPATGRATPLSGVDARERAAKSVSSPAVADLDGDGRLEIVVASNEEYGGEPDGFAIESNLLRAIRNLLGGEELAFDVQGRVYAVRPDGDAHPGGPFLPGWPVRLPLLAPGLLPTVATGTPGSPAVADVTGAGALRVAIFAAVGPVMLLAPDGSASLGEISGRRRALAVDFPAPGFPTVPASAGSPDAPFFGALGSGAFGDLDGDGLPEYVTPTGGIRRLLDVSLPAQQGLLPDPGGFVVDGLADHQVTAWDPRTGALLPAFPRVMDDMQFIATPALADVDGDAEAEVIAGSGAYLIRAYRADGSQPAGWPKFTHGWQIASPSAGDVDGDGRVEVVAATREGRLFVWDTPAPAGRDAVQWAGFGRDRRNTQNQASGVLTNALAAYPLDGLGWELEALGQELDGLVATLPEPDATRLARSPTPWLIPYALDEIADQAEAGTAALLPGIEWGLRLPPTPIAALAPLHARFVASLRAAVERFIARPCAPGNGRCERAVIGSHWLIVIGDHFHGRGDDQAAVMFWSRAIALFEGA